MLYFGTFDKLSGKYILAGGSNPNEAKLLDISNRHYATFYGFSGDVYAGDFSNNNKMVALGGADGYARVYTVDLD